MCLLIQALRDNIDSQIDAVEVMRKAGNDLIASSLPNDPHVRGQYSELLILPHLAEDSPFFSSFFHHSSDFVFKLSKKHQVF